MKTKQGYIQVQLWDPAEEKFQKGAAKTAKLFDEGGSPAPTYHDVDLTLDMWLSPPLMAVVQSIMVEIAEEREAGTLRPFVEGEPIGMIQKRKPFKPPTESRAQRYERIQKELRTLRAKNDHAITRILGEKK